MINHRTEVLEDKLDATGIAITTEFRQVIEELKVDFTSQFNKLFEERFNASFDKKAAPQVLASEKLQTNLNLLQTNITNLETKTQKLAKHKPLGTAYIRWGNMRCPKGSKQMYYGQIAGSSSTDSGGAANSLCLPKSTWGDENQNWHVSMSNLRYLSSITGAIYHLYSGGARSYPYEKKLYKDAACVICESPRSMQVMVAAKASCPKGWHMEYNGYLMSGHPSHKSATEYICMDKKMESLTTETKNGPGRLFYLTLTHCGILKCPPMKRGYAIACAVCTK